MDNSLLKNIKTLPHLLKIQAEMKAHDAAFTFIENGDRRSLTFLELHNSAMLIANGLLSLVGRGDRVVLLCPAGLDFIKLMFGCMYAGVIAVPLYPPRVKQRNTRISNILVNSKASLIVTSSQLKPSLSVYFEEQYPSLAGLIVDIDHFASALEQHNLPYLEEDELAFIQYTSGSTGIPKGVVISHGNIMANLQALKELTRCTVNDVFVNWLPLFHDLGLINTVMLPVYLGAHSVLMNSVSFVQKPLSWFQAITQYKGTICGAPNFAYELCVEKINLNELAEIDLSSWTLAFNAAEPINPKTLERFFAAFSRIGFDQRCFYPAYGMAEATVFLSGGDRGSAPTISKFDKHALQQGRAEQVTNEGRQLVSCGRAPSNHDFHIVHPVTNEILPDGIVGEIWVTGPSVAKGYWELEQLSQETFGAKLAGSNKKFLRTGDLGFLLNKNLYISGRLKDVIIIRGQNYYPQDIEYCSGASHRDLGSNSAVAFSVEDGEVEKLVLVQEVKARLVKQLNYEEVIAAIRNAIALEFELKVNVVLVKQGSLSKTSSGKVQRSLVKSNYLGGQLSVIPHTGVGKPAAPVSGHNFNALELRLVNLWSEILKIQIPSLDSDFFSLAGDSLDAVRLQVKLEQEYGAVFPADFIYTHSTVTDQYSFILAAANGMKSKELSSISAADINDEYPLSFAQQRIWFLNQMENQRKTLNISAVLSLKGDLDPSRLSKAINRIVDRHEILRTSYIWRDNHAVQYINEFRPVDITFCDLQSATDGLKQATKIANDLAEMQFDLTQGKIFDFHLLKLNDLHHHLIFTVHHIAIDAWAIGVFIDELKSFYINVESDLTSPDVRYVDFSIWQRKNYEIHEATLCGYWKRKLEGSPSLLVLPYDRQRPAKQDYFGAKYSLKFNEKTLDRLKKISQKNKSTLFAVMLAAYQLLLHRLSGSVDLIIGTDVANRNHKQISNVIGFFVNQLVLRNSIESHFSFEDLIKSNKKMLGDALAHQDMPFDKLVELLGHDRSSSYAPVFQVKFLLNNSPVNSLCLSGLEIEEVAQDSQHAQYDLTLSIDLNRNAGFIASFHYNTALFDECTIIDFMHDYELILESVAGNDAITLSDIPCFQTQKSTYQSWVHGDPCKVGLSIKESIELQAKCAPERIAISYLNQSMSYFDLNAESNRLAHFIDDIGVCSNDIVGVHFERSINQIVTLVALMKLGVGFLPLDPAYPIERIEFMLNDSEINYVITSDAAHEHLANFDGGIIPLNCDRDLIAQESGGNLEGRNFDPSCIAYLLYTSGSSGLPKGVLTSSAALLNLCAWYQKFANITKDSCVLQPISLSFDASIKNILTPLMVGAQLVLPTNDPFDPAIFCSLISAHKVTSINCVPSLFYPILTLAKKNNFECLRTLKILLLGGESPDLVKLKPWMQSEGWDCEIANIYGPTECTDISTAFRFDNNPAHNLDILPIGKPIANCKVYVVDKYLNLVPPGVSGELLIGGSCVGVGYVGQAKVGAESDKFIDDVFSKSGKLYRSGDLVKWNRDGCLIYQGRLDDQIKINGIRIEIAEIERALLSNGAVAQCKVLHIQNRLVAYLVADSLNPPNANQLRDRLAECLPQASIPGIFMWLEAIPLLPNGKVDVNELKALPIIESMAHREIDLPQTEPEKILAEIWREVLGTSQVGINENFFHLGGDSMLAVKVVAMANEKKLSLSVADIFEYQTIQKLSLQESVSGGEFKLNKSHDIVKKSSFDMLSEEDMMMFNELN